MNISELIAEIAPKFPVIAEKQQEVYQSGINLGMSQGYDVGFDDGGNSVRHAMVDMVTNNGTRESLNYAFAYWSEWAFYPTFGIKPTGQCPSAFMGFKGQIDLASRLEECGVEFDFSGSTNIGYIFMNAEITRVPKLNFTSSSNLEGIFYKAPFIETIDELVIKDDGSQAFVDSSFMSTPNLKNLKITGVIGKNGFNVRWSPLLTEASILNILAVLSTTTQGLTVTLPLAAVTREFAKYSEDGNGVLTAEWAYATSERTNWNIVLV